MSYGRYVCCLLSFCVAGGAPPTRIRPVLPTVAPAGFDEINDDIDALPDPDLLCAENAPRHGTHREVAEPHRGVS